MARETLEAAREMMQLFMGFIPARAIYVAAKLGLADRLSDGAARADEIAADVSADPDALYRVMRLLAGIGVLHQDADDRFSLTALGETLRRDGAGSVRDYVVLYHEIQYPNMTHLLDAVRTGEAVFAKTFGLPVFDYFQADAEAAAIFHAGLRNRAAVDSTAILDAYDFAPARRIVDVGGGNGALLSAILARHAGVRGVLCDLESAIAGARAGKGGPLPRCDLVVGDFFREVPAGGDVYILKLVLHDWPDDDAARILASCRAAMGGDARLLIIEGLIGPPNALSLTMTTDLMTLASFSGVERTKDAFVTLLDRAGLRLLRTLPTAGELSILEAGRP